MNPPEIHRVGATFTVALCSRMLSGHSSLMHRISGTTARVAPTTTFFGKLKARSETGTGLCHVRKNYSLE